ncbi:GH32 C-terminal domain-containing protein [Halostella salina]|uniref:GH32 C-terminal domain-containing protein n=1 Tax=Halostella salina TaxID=1547897 RepID=UPI000EF82122|nr:GH32 C-terminal domain-containing protein [Halostella salina]
MNGAAVDVCCLYAGALSHEQEAAYDWCRSAAASADAVPVGDVRRGDADLTAYDALWWHDDARVADERSVAEVAPAVREFVAGGGGLFLSGRALSLVATFGFDDVPPDATGRESLTRDDGFLWAARHADHPAVDGDLRITTLPAGNDHSYARYESVVPARGELLASMTRGRDDSPYEMSTFAWSHGDGTVIGCGAGLLFDADGYAAERSQVAGGILASLADDGGWSTTGRPKSADELAATRRELDAADRHRPRYHLTPPANWLNDPNGVVQYDGRYHVFYQYNPVGPFHHAIHWGHAVSDDLVHWADEPVALTPSPDGPDRDGCWSGCTVVDEDGTPTILYTGGRGSEQLPCLARAGDPDLRTWVKADDNPVIDEPPSSPALRGTDHWDAEFRDHCVWRADGEWHHLIGAGVEGVGGTALLYRGDTLRDWEYVGPVLTGDWDGAGDVWECPELLDFGDTQLLHVSNYEDVLYFLGEFDGETFERESTGLLDHGDFYAPQSTTDDDGRVLTWGWVMEAREGPAQWNAGWSGALSLPRVLTVEDGELRQRPAAELRDLRTERLRSGTTTVDSPDPTPLDASGTAVEIEATVDLADADEFGLQVLASPDGEEATTIRAAEGEVAVERDAASLHPAADGSTQTMPVGDGEIDLRVFVDGSVVEVFANERRCLTSRVYPTRADSDRIAAFAEGGTVETDIDVWRLAGAWSERGERAESAVRQ